MMIKKVAWFVLFALVAAACLDNPDCFNLNNNIVGISFRKMYDGKSDTVALVSISAAATDSVFQEFVLTNGVYLPLDYLNQQTTFYFERPDGTVQSLVLGYAAKTQFVSEDCGERFVLSSLEILDHQFDSARLIYATPVTSTGTNIALYRCPITNVVKFGFRQLNTDTVKIGTPLSVSINTITDDYSGVTLYSDTTLNAVRLPLNGAAGSTQFQFSLANGDSSIAVSYTAVDSVVLLKCGTQRFFDNLAVTSSEFPLTRVVNDSIQDPPITNVLLMRCPETNLVKIVFKAQTTTGTNQAQAITRITTDYSSEVFYEEANTNTVTLPLNANATTTTFTFDFASGVSKSLTLQYTFDSPFHEGCTDQLIKSLTVVSSGFTTTPAITNADVKFPTVNNIAVVNN